MLTATMTSQPDLIAHMEWADSSLWKAFPGEQGLDSRLVEGLHHIHLVQHAFLRLWKGNEPEFPEASSFADVFALAQWGREAHHGIQSFTAGATESELRAELPIPWAERLAERWGGPVEPVTVSESIVQVAMHSAHHRGQVAQNLRELEIEPPTFDFIVWLWQGRPRAQWPVADDP